MSEPRIVVLTMTMQLATDSEPEMTMTLRLPWPEDLTQDEFWIQAAETACRKLHAPKWEVRFA